MRKRSPVFNLALGIIGLLFITSCVTTMKGYTGPDRPVQEVSVIAAVPNTILYKCDGIKLSSATEIVVLPGRHTIEIGFQEKQGSRVVWEKTPVLLEFATEAGHRYEVKTNAPSGRFGGWKTVVWDSNRGTEVLLRHPIGEENLKSVEQAIRQQPNNPAAWFAKGSALIAVKRLEEALKAYDKALELDPKYAPAYFARGFVYYSVGNFQQAITDYDTAIELDPQHVEAHYNRGLAYGNLGNLQQAVRGFDKATELDPKNVKAYNSRGLAYRDLGNEEQAVRDWAKAMEVDPEYPNAYNNYAWMLATHESPKHRDGKRAVEYGEKAVFLSEKRNDDNRMKSMCYDTLAAAYAEIGEFEKAVLMVSKAYELYEPTSGTDIRKGRLKELIEAYSKKQTYLEWEKKKRP
jgi:tetratricopeptide (TPR) repeat protein